MDRDTTVDADQQEDRLAAMSSPDVNALQPNGFAGGGDASKTHRKRTMGENLFDATAYVGLGMGGNEVAATSIVKQGDQPNLIGRAIRGSQQLVEARGPKIPYVQKRMVWTTFALGGGMLMVPLIKILEDHKGKLVRMADSVLHGKRADDDPAIRQAHEEMDHAPRQTWSSLWKGRLVTIATAYAVDVAFIWPGALTSKLFKGTAVEKYSTLDAISHRIADGLGDGLLRGWTAKNPVSRKDWLRQGVSLLSFSTVLAALFYGSSKLFASRQEKKQEIRLARQQEMGTYGTARDEAPDEATEQAPGKDTPSTRVAKVESLSRIDAAPQPQLSAGA
jgi:hypothetical protein